MTFKFYSSRHFPVYLAHAIRLLAMTLRDQDGNPLPHYKIHNRALLRGLKAIWAEADMGEWPGRERLELGGTLGQTVITQAEPVEE